ncbi:MAG: hypothetical protein GF393_12255 [Armatimonadia bacterium]|nr:hypothetical protein [Armatimonadia bacterium]
MMPWIIATGIAFGAQGAAEWPVDVYCSTGDHLWVAEREPVDSPASIEAMVEWMSATYDVRRLYWRGGGSEIWDRHYQIGPDRPKQYDWAVNWKRLLFREEGINRVALRAAHNRGMEAYLYTGLFEHGVQPDVGIIAPYLIEDRLRIQHPEWCMLDRWGERRCPGPLSLAYPEVRRRLVDRFAEAVRDHGYDGVTFYTYVENVGLRYPEEFGYNQPVIDRFRERYPETDPRTAELTYEQREHFQRCRGHFVTQYLRELHQALSDEGAEIMMILDASNPDVPQPWWGKPAPGTGPIHLDWERWIEEGIVDGIWVQLGGMEDQLATLDRVLAASGDRESDIVVRTASPWLEAWKPYIDAGVTPVAVITAPRNGIERYTLEPVDAKALQAADWKLRAQALADAAEGRMSLTIDQIAPVTRDEHVLVRRRAMHALGTLATPEAGMLLERALDDPESSVRIAAAASLADCHRQESVAAILAALTHDDGFQFKEACVDALAAIGEQAIDRIAAATSSGEESVREVCVRAVYRIGREAGAESVVDTLTSHARDAAEAPHIRYHAITGMVGLRLEIPGQRRAQMARDLIKLLEMGEPPMVQHRAAWGLGHLANTIATDLRKDAVEALVRQFRGFGDGCDRPDAAYGWRPVGNAILRFATPGRDALERMRTQKEDRWLAWIAYQVAHVPQTGQKMVLVEEADALAVHDRFAPDFPGWRRW